jgi:hypothetical protein
VEALRRGATIDEQHVARTAQRLGAGLVEDLRESIFDVTWNAIRDGRLASIRPVIAVTVRRNRWSCVGFRQSLKTLTRSAFAKNGSPHPVRTIGR